MIFDHVKNREAKGKMLFAFLFCERDSGGKYATGDDKDARGESYAD
jgi:hypothetical protein